MLKQLYIGCCFTLITVLVAGCGLNPQNADIDLNETLPEAKVTVFSDAVKQIGMMTVIYNTPKLKIMTKKGMDDKTGTSIATSAEIPREVTDMVESTLNGMGGNVLFIPYDPEFMQNTVLTGYTEFEDKIVPQVLVSGGITEFDRGLVTKGDEFNVDAQMGQYGIEFSDQNKSSLASVTLDFNLIDFKTFTGIPRIQAINSIKLHKATKEDSLGFTLKSVTFGAKGEIKKVQGRHAAVRMLVQLSMVQLAGRYLKLPYWNLLPGAERDEVVIDQVLSDFYAMSPEQQIAKIQEYLYLRGENVTVNGQMDGATQNALQKFASEKSVPATVDQNTFLALFESVPINHQTQQRAKVLQANLGAPGAVAIYQPPTYMPSVAPVTGPDTGTITLRTDKSSYQIGEQLNLSFTVDKPMFVRIAVINAKGGVSTLFPNPYQSDNYCKPGVAYSIPPRGADFTLDIGGPAGKDKIRAVGSQKPIPADAMVFTSQGEFDETRMAQYTVRAGIEYMIR